MAEAGDDPEDEGGGHQGRAALLKRSRWPGWIWAVPIAVFGIVAYLAIQEFVRLGPHVTVTFATSGGMMEGDTKVTYKGMEVGEVASISLREDLQSVDVGLRLDSSLAGHLGPGTRFWMIGTSPSISDVASLKAALTGPVIEVDPHPGAALDRYDGLEAPPVIQGAPAGSRYTLHAAQLGNVSAGSPIYYRDLQVGQVAAYRFIEGERRFAITAFVRAPFDRLVHDGTRFWNAGAVQLAMSPGGPQLQLQSVPALIEGALAFETPDGPVAGAISRDGADFPLYADADTAMHAPDRRAVQYRVVFHRPTDALRSGAPVELAGTRIGTVRDTSLEYDPETGDLRLPATIALEPGRVRLAGGAAWQDDARPQMDAMLRRLIGEGLRAQLGSTVPVVGGKTVSLAFLGGAGEAGLGPGPLPEIPTGPGGGVQGVVTAVNAVLAKINAMPLDQIAADVHATTGELARLSRSPELTQSLTHLDASLANIERISRDARAEAPPIMAGVRRVAGEAQQTLASAQALLSSTQGGGQPQTADLPGALYELSRAARSLRELSDYLDRHPEALLQGRAASQ